VAGGDVAGGEASALGTAGCAADREPRREKDSFLMSAAMDGGLPPIGLWLAWISNRAAKVADRPMAVPLIIFPFSFWLGP
jgi:hypothetical protein